MRIDVAAFISSLRFMIEGWLGIFIVMGVIIGVVMLLNKYGNEFEAKAKAKEEAEKNA